MHLKKENGYNTADNLMLRKRGKQESDNKRF
jgi:hypothetical protein